MILGEEQGGRKKEFCIPAASATRNRRPLIVHPHSCQDLPSVRIQVYDRDREGEGMEERKDKGDEQRKCEVLFLAFAFQEKV